MSQEIEILPVFISSTWLDLRPEHEAAERAVNSMRETKYVGMKYFGARDENTRRASLNEVDRSRVYVGIIGDRYGSGITEDEYERASARCLQRFIYFKADASTPDDGRETDPEQLAKLAAFKQKLRAAHTVKEFVTPDDLAAQVTSALHRRLFDDYLTPKLRGALSGEVSRNEAQTLLDAVKDFSELSRELPAQLQSKGFNVSIEGDFVAGNKTVNVYNTPTVSAPPIPTLHQLRAPVGDFVGREKEINELLAAMRGGASAAISGISGMGGIGKTELAFYVAERLRDTYPDAQLVVDMRGTDERPRDPHASRRALPDSVRECSVLYLKGGDDIKNGIALFDVERRNIEAGQKWACRHASGDEAAARLCNEYPTAGVYVLALRLHPREFISWLEAALVAARQLKDRDSEGRHSGNLGIVYRTLGAPRRAVEFYEQQLIIAREIGDRSGEGNALFNIGLAVNKLGDNAKAIAHVEGALEIFEQIESPHVERARAVLAQWRGEA